MINSVEEKFREFVVRRQLRGEGMFISEVEYQSLKDRDGHFWSSLSASRAHYLEGYMDGWKESRR